MKPLDPRLVRTAGAVRTHLAVTVVSGVLITGLILAQAWLLARVITGAWAGEGMDVLGWMIATVAAVAIARALLSYLAETSALHSAARTKSQLRRRLVAHVTGSGKVWLAEGGDREDGSPKAGELVTLTTRGLDALDEYFSRYLPQLVLASIVPFAVLAVVFWADWISGIVIMVTLPLIPIFMALIGMHTQQRTERQWRLLSRLGGHFLDVVEGLPTLAVFRRAKAQAAIIRKVGEDHRSATMGTLRIAFLSAFALELLATLAVALVAVEVGLRLLGGHMDYQTALLVLILAPEAYLPLREVGARFHASMEGVAAADQVFTELDRKRGATGRGGTEEEREGEEQRAPAPTGTPSPAAAGDIRFEGVGLLYPGRDVPALSGLDLTVRAGEHLLLTGPSGSGKTTLLSLLLRLGEPTEGQISVREPGGEWTPIEQVAADDWRLGIAWVPQHPYLFDVSVADNIRLGAPDADMDRVREAARLAEADGFVSALPDGYETRLGERGARLSAGQRQRIALARAMCRDAPLVLLDEPTAHLDPENARAVRTAVTRLLEGRTAVIVAHDTGWAESALGDNLRTAALPLLTREARR